MENLESRKKRIIARGEHSNHAHVLVGDVEWAPDGFVVPEGSDVEIRHVLESIFLKTGETIWTGEHHPVKLIPGKYQYVPQTEWDPYMEEIRRVKD